MNQHGVSIIICCHNGAARMSDTVRHLAMQNVPRYIPWEFILIDNACSDNSVPIAEAVWSEFAPTAPLRVVHEPKLGLSHARTRGFIEAQYEFVIMCDDDNWLAPNYVELTYQIMRDHPKVAALGGCGKLVFEISAPPYLEQSMIFAAGPQAPHSGKVQTHRLYGAGCVIRKSAHEKLKELGFKSFLEDRKGTSLSSGGDHELCYALAISGYHIWYDERLKFLHYITKERLTWEYFVRYARESATCFDVLTSYKMVANGYSTYKFTHLSISRDFFYCLRRFLKVNLSRMFTRSESVTAKVLYFRHLILARKIQAYLNKFDDMERHHEAILNFKEACVQADMIKRPAPPDTLTRLKFIFSLGLYRQPQ